MIKSFKNKLAENLFHGKQSKETRRFPPDLHRAALRKLTQLDAATVLHTLSVPPKNQLEALKKDRVGQHSIRINDQWRVCFVWTDEGPKNVEIVDYH
jgi:proteic killer suppression protein